MMIDGGSASDIGAGEVEAGAGDAGVIAGALAGAGGAGSAGGAGDGGSGGEPGAGDRWQDKFLPETMRTDASLALYKDIPAAAQALIDTKRMVGERFALPKDGDASSFDEFAGRLRPAEASAYDLKVPEGQDSAFADAMKPILHKAGLHPSQAAILNEGWNQHILDQASQLRQANVDQLTAIELEMGSAAYNQRLLAVDAMFEASGVDSDKITHALEQVQGGGEALKALFALAEKTGELAKVSGDEAMVNAGLMTKAAATAQYNAKLADKEFLAKAAIKGSPEQRQWDAIAVAMAKGA
jgi:hypothetical protein